MSKDIQSGCPSLLFKLSLQDFPYLKSGMKDVGVRLEVGLVEDDGLLSALALDPPLDLGGGGPVHHHTDMQYDVD